MYVNSYYNKILRSSDKVTARGFNYIESGLLNKMLSPRMYLVPRIKDFLELLDPSLIELLESVKRIQFFYNYTMDKNDRSLNF